MPRLIHGSASFSFQRGDARGRYAGVNEQTGIQAGQELRPTETGFAAMTGALAGPVGANVRFMNNVLLGAVTGSANTARDRGYSASATQSPDFPPCFSITLTSVMIIPRSTALHMS